MRIVLFDDDGTELVTIDPTIKETGTHVNDIELARMFIVSRMDTGFRPYQVKYFNDKYTQYCTQPVNDLFVTRLGLPDCFKLPKNLDFSDRRINYINENGHKDTCYSSRSFLAPGDEVSFGEFMLIYDILNESIKDFNFQACEIVISPEQPPNVGEYMFNAEDSKGLHDRNGQHIRIDYLPKYSFISSLQKENMGLSKVTPTQARRVTNILKQKGSTILIKLVVDASYSFNNKIRTERG